MRNATLTCSLLSLSTVVGLLCCQAPTEPGDDGTSAAQSDRTRAAILGSDCVSTAEGVEPGIYILILTGASSRTQQTSEFDYNGAPTLLQPVYDGTCFAPTPRG